MPQFSDPADDVEPEEDAMAKDQRRGNREVRKPKKIKSILAVTPALQIKGQPAAIDIPKRKG